MYIYYVYDFMKMNKHSFFVQKTTSFVVFILYK